MELNVHNLFLKDAIDEIMIKFDECEEIGDIILVIIHGHKHGTRIRDYIRSDGFLNEVNRKGHKITNKSFSDKGVTIFQIRPSIRSSKKSPIAKFESSENTSKNKVSGIYCIKCKEIMVLLKEFNWYKCPKCGKLKKR